MIRVYDDAGNVIKTHEHNGDFKSDQLSYPKCLDNFDELRVKGVYPPPQAA